MQMATLIGRGIEMEDNCIARIRTVPPVSPANETSSPSVPTDGPPYVSRDDLGAVGGLALGSPTRFGNMAAPLKHFLDQTGAEWFSGTLTGKPAAVFTSSSTQHGGQETTLVSMMLPLLHHGMLIVGLPFRESELNQTRTGGTPYGVSHVAGFANDQPVSEAERRLCLAQGRRLARAARALATVTV